MSSTRTWAAGTAVVSILLVIVAWFLLIGPQRGDAADARTQKVTQEQANQALAVTISQLKASSASLPAKQAELEVIKRQMPNNPALPTLIRSLSSIAAASGVTLDEVAPQQPVAATTTAPATGTGGATTGAVTTGTNGLVRIPIAITVHGTYAENELFLQKVQTGITRALLVEQLAIRPASQSAAGTGTTSTPDGEIVQSVITGSVFVLPDSVPGSASLTGVTGGTGRTGTTGTTTTTGSAS